MDFWFEFASTYSYPVALRVEQVAREAAFVNPWISMAIFVGLNGYFPWPRRNQPIDPA